LLRGRDAAPLAFAETVTVSTATTPLPMTPECNPVATQVSMPLPLLQLRALPEAVNAEPGAASSEVIVAEGYERLHCNEDGALPVTLSERFSKTVEPGVVEPEPTLREFCANAQLATNKIKMPKRTGVAHLAERDILGQNIG